MATSPPTAPPTTAPTGNFLPPDDVDAPSELDPPGVFVLVAVGRDVEEEDVEVVCVLPKRMSPSSTRR